MVPPLQLYPLLFEGNTCRSYKTFVGTSLHPPQVEIPHQTPSARPKYMPHTGMWCPFCFLFCQTCALRTLGGGGGGNPFNLYNNCIIIHRKQANCLGRQLAALSE